MQTVAAKSGATMNRQVDPVKLLLQPHGIACLQMDAVKRSAAFFGAHPVFLST